MLVIGFGDSCRGAGGAFRIADLGLDKPWAGEGKPAAFEFVVTKVPGGFGFDGEVMAFGEIGGLPVPIRCKASGALALPSCCAVAEPTPDRSGSRAVAFELLAD